MERKLTAILSAEVKGYSRLMGEDEKSFSYQLSALELTSGPFFDFRGVQEIGKSAV